MRMASTIAAAHRQTEELFIFGIAEGGVPFAHKLQAALYKHLGRTIPCGSLNISFHRDDIFQRPITKVIAPTEVPGDIQNATVILADDVLFSGRTIRAALNELFDQGRPNTVELAILFDRGNRKLPIHANYTGFSENTNPQQTVKVNLDTDEEQNDLILISEDC